MKENKLTIFIDKPVNEVFEYSLESNNVPKWILSIKEEIPSERPVKIGTQLKNVGVNSSNWNYYEVIAFEQDKTFTLKRLNGDYFVKYTCIPKENGTEFEYYEWAEKGELDDLMEEYEETISAFNACTTAWDNKFLFEQKVKYEYAEKDLRKVLQG